MSTNYYWHPAVPHPCSLCGRPYDYTPVHIGKSSQGWVFSLRTYPDGLDGFGPVASLADWVGFFASRRGQVRSEYGEELSVADIIRVITERTHPGGLMRHEGIPEATPGPGSWDLCPYEFC